MQLDEEKIVKHVMQHNKGKVLVSKPIVIGTKLSDNVIHYSTGAPVTTTISSPLVTNYSILVSIMTPSILANSSSQEK